MQLRMRKPCIEKTLRAAGRHAGKYLPKSQDSRIIFEHRVRTPKKTELGPWIACLVSVQRQRCAD